MQEPPFFDQRTLLIKVNADPDVPEELAAATHAFELFNGKATTEADKVERPRDRAFFGGKPFASTNRRRSIEGDFELFPPADPGTDSAPAAPMLFVGGMAETLATGLTRYNPISRDIATATAHWFQGKRFTQLEAARAAISGMTFKVGDRLMAKTKLQGSFTEVLEEDLPTDVDYSAFGEPTVITNENSRMFINGLEVLGRELSWDFGSDLKRKEFTRKAFNRIAGRNPTFKALFAPPETHDDLDPWTLQKLGTQFAMDAFLIEDDGRIAWLHVRGQVENPNEADEDNDYLYELTGPCIPTDAGGDEFFIAFGAALGVTGTLAAGQVGVAYSQSLTVTGQHFGTGTWSLLSGDLPDGTTLNPSTGAVAGDPTDADTFVFTLRFTDVLGRTVDSPQSVTIAPA